MKQIKNWVKKKTSDKSNNNPIGVSNDKDTKLDLNESNEKNNSGSINPKVINIIYPNIQKGPFNIIKKKKLGRKRRINGQKGKHNKFCYDNITRKLKGLLINNYILNFVNTIIKEGEKSKSIKKREKNNKLEENKISVLVKINQEIIENIDREYNLNLLNLELKEIYSNNITPKIKNLKKDYNKKLIDKIYLNNKNKKAINIFNKALNQYINHLTNKEFYPELQGLENEYKNIINQLKDSGETDEYIELFIDLFGRFEEFYKNKRIYNGNKKIEIKLQK